MPAAALIATLDFLGVDIVSIAYGNWVIGVVLKYCG